MSILLAAPSTAALAQSCESYVGQPVNLLTFAQALTYVPNVEPKGEFETTAEFETRRQQATAGKGGPLLVSKAPEDRKYLEYDADAQRLGIKMFAFDDTGFSATDAFYNIAAANSLEASSFANFDTVISTNENVAGSYEGQNAYGAKATVVKVTRKIEAIFDRPRDLKTDQNSGLFPAADKSPHMVGYLSLSTTEAQRLKPLLKLAYVVEPKQPYVVKRSYLSGKTTVASPREVTEDVTVLIADIKCGLVTDDKDVVLGAYPTR